MIERGHNLLDAAGGTLEPTLFIEPGLEKIFKDNGWSGRHIQELSRISPYGGETNSWPSAQTTTALFLSALHVYDTQCGDNDKYKWRLEDLTTNFIYGDITFNNYSSSTPDNDSAVAKLGQGWSHLSDDQIAHHLSSFIDEYRNTCTIKELQ